MQRNSPIMPQQPPPPAVPQTPNDSSAADSASRKRKNTSVSATDTDTTSTVTGKSEQIFCGTCKPVLTRLIATTRKRNDNLGSAGTNEQIKKIAHEYQIDITRYLSQPPDGIPHTCVKKIPVFLESQAGISFMQKLLPMLQQNWMENYMTHDQYVDKKTYQEAVKTLRQMLPANYKARDPPCTCPQHQVVNIAHIQSQDHTQLQVQNYGTLEKTLRCILPPQEFTLHYQYKKGINTVQDQISLNTYFEYKQQEPVVIRIYTYGPESSLQNNLNYMDEISGGSGGDYGWPPPGSSGGDNGGPPPGNDGGDEFSAPPNTTYSSGNFNGLQLKTLFYNEVVDGLDLVYDAFYSEKKTTIAAENTVDTKEFTSILTLEQQNPRHEEIETNKDENNHRPWTRSQTAALGGKQLVEPDDTSGVEPKRKSSKFPSVEDKKSKHPEAREEKPKFPKVEEKKLKSPKVEEKKPRSPKIEEKKPKSPKIEGNEQRPSGLSKPEELEMVGNKVHKILSTTSYTGRQMTISKTEVHRVDIKTTPLSIQNVAAGSALASLTDSAITNTLAYSRGEKSGTQAAVQVLKDTATGGIVGSALATIPLAGVAIPAVFGAAETCTAIFKYMKGELSGQQCAENVAKSFTVRTGGAVGAAAMAAGVAYVLSFATAIGPLMWALPIIGSALGYNVGSRAADQAFSQATDRIHAWMRNKERAEVLQDAYNFLRVPSDAPDSEVAQAYHKLAQVLHPDKGGDAEMFTKLAFYVEIIRAHRTNQPLSSNQVLRLEYK